MPLEITSKACFAIALDCTKRLLYKTKPACMLFQMKAPASASIAKRYVRSLVASSKGAIA